MMIVAVWISLNIRSLFVVKTILVKFSNLLNNNAFQ